MSAIYQKDLRETVSSVLSAIIPGRKTLLESSTVRAHNKPRNRGKNDPKKLFCLTHTDYLFSRNETLLTGKPNPNVEI